MKILVTLGGTEEPLDGVRCLSNRSTGSTGRAIAAHFASRGAQVTLLHAERVQVGPLRCRFALHVFAPCLRIKSFLGPIKKGRRQGCHRPFCPRKDLNLHVLTYTRP